MAEKFNILPRDTELIAEAKRIMDALGMPPLDQLDLVDDYLQSIRAALVPLKEAVFGLHESQTILWRAYEDASVVPKDGTECKGEVIAEYTRRLRLLGDLTQLIHAMEIRSLIVDGHPSPLPVTPIPGPSTASSGPPPSKKPRKDGSGPSNPPQ